MFAMVYAPISISVIDDIELPFWAIDVPEFAVVFTFICVLYVVALVVAGASKYVAPCMLIVCTNVAPATFIDKGKFRS
jgi:hypothetical protein